MNCENKNDFVEKCKASFINNYHDVFIKDHAPVLEEDEPLRQRCINELISLRNPSLRHIDEFRKEIFLNPENRPKLFTDFLISIGIDEPGIYEIVGDVQAGKTTLLKRLINEFALADFEFLVTNNLDDTKNRPHSFHVKHVFAFKDLVMTFSMVHNKLIKEGILFPVIFVDDFSVMAYEMEEIPTYQFVVFEFIKICRKIRDELLGIIVMTSLPKKTRMHVPQFGGLISSPWRNAIDKSLYVKVDDGNLRVETVDGFTREKRVAHVVLNK